MRRFRALSLLLLLPLVALAQPSERSTMTLTGQGYHDLELEGEARFGGNPGDRDLPQGTNSVITFEGDDGSVGVLFSKDIARPRARSSRLRHSNRVWSTASSATMAR